MKDKKPKILLVGGGTLGSVSPLLAITEQYDADYLFVGTKNGPEKRVVTSKLIEYMWIYSGKLRRYFDWQNFLDIFRVKIAFWQSIWILTKFKPDIVLTAGSFVAVPVVLAAWFLRIPIIAHQQDIKVGLANKLIAPFVNKITVTFEEQKQDFNQKKVVVTGNPVRKLKEESVSKPIVIITGGGLGARGLNTFVSEFIPKLLKKYEVHHILGEINWNQKLYLDGYHPHKFVLNGMMELLSRADIIISRAGISLITEAAFLKKALVLIPMPNTHQEKNAAFLAKHNAALTVKQDSNHVLDRYLSKLLENSKLRDDLGSNLNKLFPKDAVSKYIKLIDEVRKH